MNLPISTSVPGPSAAAASSASAPTQGAQAGDPFGSLLASQLAGPTAAGTSSAATSTDTLIAAANDKKDSRQHAADAANTPAADVLAALLAVPATPTAVPAPEKIAAATAPALDARTGSVQPGDPGAALVPGKPLEAKSSAAPAPNGNVANGQPGEFATALRTLAADKSPHGSQAIAAQPRMAAPDVAAQAAAAAPALLPQMNQPQASGAAAAQLTLDSPVGSRNWGSDLGQKISWMSTQNQHSAELHLNPPDLGPLNVVLSVDGSHASAMFTSPHAAVRDAVEQALPQLREMMASSGIMLGNATVSDQRPNSQDGQAPQRSSRLAAAGDAGSAISGMTQGAATLPPNRHNGLVDTFA